MENGEPKPQRTPRVTGGQQNNKNSVVKHAEEIVARRKARNKRRAARRKARGQQARGSLDPSKLGQTVAEFAKGELSEGFSVNKLPAPARIALGIALPNLIPLSRMVSEFADSPTAIANPFTRLPAEWSSDTDVLPCFVFRNAERSIVLYDANSGSNAWAYGFYGTNKLTQLPASNWTQTVTSDTKTYLHIPYALSLDDYEPHGDLMLAGSADDEKAARFFWFNNTDKLQLSVTLPVQSGITYSFAVDLDYWSPRAGVMSEVSHAFVQSNVTGGTYTLSATNMNTFTGWMGSGYYAFSFSMEVFAVGVKVFGGDEDIVFSNFEVSSNGPCIGHRCAPNYFTNIGAVSGVRVSAVAVKYTNTSAFNDLQGEVTVYQAPQSKHWQDFFTYSNLVAAKGNETFNVRNGDYHFLKPTQPEDFDFQSYVFVENGVLCDSFYPLKEKSGFLCASPKIEDPQGRTGFFQFDFGFEYQTSDVWRDVFLPSDKLADWNRAMEIVRGMPQYYENPTHVRDIFRNVLRNGAKVTKWGLNNGPKVLGLLNALSGVV